MFRIGVWLLLGGCLREVAPGPDLGACADIPEGVYGYGEAGIGTCIAGPTGMTFFEQGGTEWLAVTNADPFREYRTGSVLVINWDELEAQLPDAPLELPMDQVAATSLEIFDSDDGDEDGSNPFLGRIVYLPDQQKLVSPGRFSESGDYDNSPILRSSKDDVWVVDTTDLTSDLAGDSLALAESIELEDDPFPIVYDAAASRVYVGNLTDHSVSVLDVGTNPVLTEVDVAPGATTTEAPFVDADQSGSFGEVTTLEVLEPAEVVEDNWTLTYIEQTAEVWVAAPVNDTIDGVRQYSTGDTLNYVPSAFPVELGLGEVRDPFLTVGPDGLPWMFYARPNGELYFAVSAYPYKGGEWQTTENVLVPGPDFLGSPSVAPFVETVGFYLYTERRADVDGEASIAVTTSTNLVDWSLELEDVLVPPAGVSYENPFVALDGITQTYRMWLTIRTGDRFDVALAESLDGTTWSEPEVVLASTEDYANAAPALAVLDGPRYGMWLSRSDGTSWDTAFAWSYDGRHWTEPVPVIDGLLTDYVALRPPRPGVFVNFSPSTFGQTSGWSLDGANTGFIPGLLHAGRPATEVSDFEVGVTHGHVVSNNVVRDGRASGALVPGSVTEVEGRQRLYATAWDANAETGGALFGTPRIVVLDRSAAAQSVVAPPTEWELLVDGDEMDLILAVGPGESVSDPVIVQDDEGFVLFYAVDDGETVRIARATSADGIDFVPDGGFVLPAAVDGTFDAIEQRPHDLQVTADGVRLWYTAGDGTSLRIGSAVATDARGVFAREPGPTGEEWRLAAGPLGTFDGDGVKDPVIVEVDGTTHLYYSGSDGTEWRIGRRTLLDDGTFSDPRNDVATDAPRAVLSGRSLTFAELQVDSPVLLASDADERVLTFAYAGYDAVPVARIGEAMAPYETLDTWFAKMRFPTAFDQLAFGTNRGGRGTQVVELEQTADEFSTDGEGMASMALDEARGFLYVTSKLRTQIFVVDVRDDSNGGFVDSNYLDLEAVVQVDIGPPVGTNQGYRDVLVAPGRGLLYLTQRGPDALVILDPSVIVDDAAKDLILDATHAVIPLQNALDDAGADNNVTAIIGGDGMALTADERQLLVTHFRGNALSVFDLEAGAWATEVSFIQNIGENPHQVEISPDGRYAVVANYLGTVDDVTVSSNLAIVDIDPSSENYLEIVTWLVNR